ncbi:rho guanine nucleotide exchange factor 11 isoform X3 [Atheta coriaria]|uniref:rho guanine nucleotide exchange factor 11 isoform X3 n=1 Tax=Dalotia coriaria TaxID=877792 RepID=UPI0031F45B62
MRSKCQSLISLRKSKYKYLVRRSTHSNPSVRRISGGGTPYIISGPGRPTSLPDSPNSPSMNGPYQTVSVIVNRDDNGYGMKVSGDNPVFVQSVKAGGAAEKAGLFAGDRIVEVNGENVLSSTHTEVVALIKSSTQVILKVQHKTNNKTMGSPGVHGRPCSQNSQSRITGPQPVDNETQVQLQVEKEQHYKLMIEKEQRYVDSLRGQIVTHNDIKKNIELAKAEKNLLKLYGMLHNHKALQETVARDKTDNPPPLPSTPPPKQLLQNRNGNGGGCVDLFADLTTVSTDDIPPPLPKRNNRTLITDTQNNPSAQYVNGEVPLREENGNYDDGCLNQCLTSNKQSKQHISKPMFTQSRSEHENLAGLASAAPATNEGRDRCSSLGSRKGKTCKKSLSCGGGMIVDNKMYAGGGQPPPLPPRVPLNPGYEPDGANSINKQLSYPLVATCATLVNNCVPNHTHQRTKSSPESLINVSSSEASKRLIASESMTDLSRTDGYDRNATPPGTPPPPYPSPLQERKSMSNRNSANTDDGDGSFEDIPMDVILSPDVSPLRGAAFNVGGRKFLNNSLIHAATPPSSQQSIISMEDDEISESDLSQFTDHGPFKSISQLWNKENMPYLAVFVNYVLSNCDPFSLLFYLITDLYKEGSNAKEMRKWAYEIHSCFLIPGAPLRIPNVDEPIVWEIDSALQGETTGEEMLRRIFWKPRTKAKEELTKQLNEFQQKRIAGLGTIYGPKDAVLSEIVADKTGGKDIKHYESVLLERLNMNEDSETIIINDPKKYYTIAATITVVTRVFGVRLPSDVQLDRWQSFVSKEKSLRTKIMGRSSRKLNYYGHQYDAKQYYTVIRCNNCTQIIYGIAPQGYICSACHINLHRNCISHYTDLCPGKHPGKGMKTKIMDKIRNEKDQKRKQSANFIQTEKERRFAEEKDNGFDLDNESKPGNPVTRTPSDRRPDAFREESRDVDMQGQGDVENDNAPFRSSVVILPGSTTGNKQRQNNHINRSESVKEHSEKNRKQKRNVSDPLRSGEVLTFNDSTGTFQERSGSSSNSSISSRSLDNFSNHEDDSDLDVEPDPPDWKSSLTEEELSGLHTKEKARQDVINELFHTERTHVRNLKVLDQVFRKHIADTKVITEHEQNLVFANLPEVLLVHNQFNLAMKKKRAEQAVVPDIGDLLVGLFDGELGNKFCLAVSRFCEKQQQALELISEKRKRDSKFESVLASCEKNNLCRRLPLQGLIPQEMQRTTKYKLLVERLIDIQESLMRVNPELSAVELDNLKVAFNKIKGILHTANEAAAAAYNQYRLDDIKNHLDVPSDIRTCDWILVREGTVNLKRQNKTVPVHMLLLKDSVILLHKEGDRFAWKSFHTNNTWQSPFIKLSGLICRPNAADMTCLFLLSNSLSNSQMYEIQCSDETERKSWFKYLADASEPFKSKDGKNKRAERNHDAGEEAPQELSAPKPESLEQTEPISEAELATSSGSSQRNSAALEEDAIDKSVAPEGDAATSVVHSEKIKRKDEEVKKALADKEVLVADLLSIPRENYRDIADMVGEKKTDVEPCELVLASLNQANKLISAVNDSMNITDAETVAATGGKHPSCNSNELSAKQNHVPSVPASKIQPIATTLQSQLTNLLSLTKQRDEEMEKMRKELHRLREQLHEKSNLHAPQPNQYDSEESVHHESQSGDLESIEESPIETETT